MKGAKRQQRHIAVILYCSMGLIYLSVSVREVVYKLPQLSLRLQPSELMKGTKRQRRPIARLTYLSVSVREVVYKL